jgi:hypothetical protein
MSFQKIWVTSLSAVLFSFIISSSFCAYAQNQFEKVAKNHGGISTEEEINPFLYAIVTPDYSHQTLKKIYGIGRRILEHVVVKGTTKVFGYLKIVDSQLNDVEVKGRTWINSTTIKGSASTQGKTDIINTELNNLTVRGKFSINNSKVKGLLDVIGKFEAFNTTFEDRVNILGLSKIKNSFFQKEVSITGKVDAVQAYFKNTITIISEEVLLKNVTSKNIYVKKPACDKKCSRKNIWCKQCNKHQIITLAGKTVIQGSITFESNNGIILLGQEVTIKGQVIGGTIEQLVEPKK